VKGWKKALQVCKQCESLTKTVALVGTHCTQTMIEGFWTQNRSTDLLQAAKLVVAAALQEPQRRGATAEDAPATAAPAAAAPAAGAAGEVEQPQSDGATAEAAPVTAPAVFTAAAMQGTLGGGQKRALSPVPESSRQHVVRVKQEAEQ
jgi:hypothetical protein